MAIVVHIGGVFAYEPARVQSLAAIPAGMGITGSASYGT
jgi:hypothetical protein